MQTQECNTLHQIETRKTQTQRICEKLPHLNTFQVLKEHKQMMTHSNERISGLSNKIILYHNIPYAKRSLG